jgi:hypothetical protein
MFGELGKQHPLGRVGRELADQFALFGFIPKPLQVRMSFISAAPN